jgi:hypothetical protein
MICVCVCVFFVRVLIEFSNCMYDDPIYARVINLILIFFLLICFRTNARHGVWCPSVVAQYFIPSSDVRVNFVVRCACQCDRMQFEYRLRLELLQQSLRRADRHRCLHYQQLVALQNETRSRSDRLGNLDTELSIYLSLRFLLVALVVHVFCTFVCHRCENQNHWRSRDGRRVFLVSVQPRLERVPNDVGHRSLLPSLRWHSSIQAADDNDRQTYYQSANADNDRCDDKDRCAHLLVLVRDRHNRSGDTTKATTTTTAPPPTSTDAPTTEPEETSRTTRVGMQCYVGTDTCCTNQGLIAAVTIHMQGNEEVQWSF